MAILYFFLTVSPGSVHELLIWWIITLDYRRRRKPNSFILSIDRNTWWYFFLGKHDRYELVHMTKVKRVCRKIITWDTRLNYMKLLLFDYFSLQIQQSHTVQPNRHITLFYNVHIASGGKKVEHWTSIYHHKKTLEAISVIQRSSKVLQMLSQYSEWRDLSKHHVPILQVWSLKDQY